jgi:hypothetical protein
MRSTFTLQLEMAVVQQQQDIVSLKKNIENVNYYDKEIFPI